MCAQLSPFTTFTIQASTHCFFSTVLQLGLFTTPPTLVFSIHYVVNSSLQSAQSQAATGAIAAACRNIGILSEAISIPITTSMQKFEKHQAVSRYLFQREKNTRQQYICISINTSTKLGFRLVLNIYHNISKWCTVSNCAQSPAQRRLQDNHRSQPSSKAAVSRQAAFKN